MTPAERALREAVAVVEDLPRAVFSVTGERPLAYLHDVLAQDVVDLSPRHGALAAVLTANGRVAAEVRVLPVGEGVLLDAEPEAAQGIVKHVARHAPLAGVEVADVTERYAVAAVRGPNAGEALAASGLPVPGPREAEFESHGDLLVVRVAWGVPGIDLIGPRDALPAIDAERATFQELDAARIEAGRPRFGVDVSEDLLVNETPLLTHAVSMSKGCYPGQESVARIHNLGRVRRTLRSLRSDGDAITAGGDVTLNGGVVGRVTSATSTAGQAVAIGVLAAEVDAGTRVTIDGTEVIVGALV